MKIISLKIWDKDSILNKIEITSDKPINILIGENGSGKTTVLKYLAWIFKEARNKYIIHKKHSNPPFKFEIKYEILSTINNENLQIYKKVTLKNTNKEKDPWSFIVDNTDYITIKDAQLLLPENIIAYYSGWDENIKWLFQDVEEEYKEMLKERSVSNTDFGYSKIDSLPLIYIEKIQFEILLACLFSFEYNFDLDKKLLNTFNIEKQNKNSIVIFIKRPKSTFKLKSDHNNFWGASGELNQFLTNLKARAKDKGTYDSNKGIYTFIYDLKDWYDLKNFYGSEKRLYYYFHLLNASDLFSGTQLYFTKNNTTITQFNLSEGEQQLLTILGIKELLIESNTLLLLDEPDTFLHPSWQEQFADHLIENFYDDINKFEPNYFITTHSPNLLMNANKDKVKVHLLNKGKSIELHSNHYGRTISSVNYNLMGVTERPKEIAVLIESLFQQIELENIDVAKDIYIKLVDILGDDDEDLIQAKVELDFLKRIDDKN